MKTHMPWKELGYAIGFVGLLLALYVGTYCATVTRTNLAAEYTVTTAKPVMERGAISYVQHTETKLHVWRRVEPTCSMDSWLGADRTKAMFGPVHEIDRRLRPEHWKDQIVTEREPVLVDHSPY
jgi:hypothetical protein